MTSTVTVAGAVRPGHRPGGGSRRGLEPGPGAARRRRQGLVAWMFALPFVLVFGTFMLVPIASSLAMSFTDFGARDVTHPFAVSFVGVQQYLKLFADPMFRRALGVTGGFVVMGIPATIALGLALAVALNSGVTRLRAFFRVGFYAPVVTSIVAVAVVWRYILQPDGLINTALSWVGIHGPDWLHSTTLALPALTLMAVWRNTGTLMIIFLAGLQGIPEEVLEAAMIDGAGPWRRFRSITLPLLRPTILLGAVLISVGYLQFFEEPFVMTQGGPLGSTTSIAYYTYNQFGFGDFSLASASSYVLFAIIVALSLIQFRVLRTQD